MSLFLHTFSIGAIMKNEGSYLKEWLDYHIGAGVDHFYLYDNDSTDNTKSILEPYIKNGVVDYTYWPGEVQQMPAYNDMVRNYRFETEYLCFLDCDEFLFPLHGEKLADITRELLAKDCTASGLGVNWRMFGSSGLERKPVGGVLKNFVYRAADSYEKNAHIKTIANPRKIDTIGNPHFCFYFNNGYAINENGHKINGPFSKQDNGINRICINHYFTKSWEEWSLRRSRKRADTGEIRKAKEFTDPNLDEVYDNGIIKYLEGQKNGLVLAETDELANLSVEHILEAVLDVAEQDQLPDITTLLIIRHRCLKKALVQNYPVSRIEEVIFSLIEMQIKTGKITVEEFQLLSSLCDEKNITEEIQRKWLFAPMYHMACWWRKYYWQKNDGTRMIYFTKMRDILCQYATVPLQYDGEQLPMMDVIIPVHDMPNRLKACVESVLYNTTMPYRLIVVDDASSDYATKKFLQAMVDCPKTEWLKEVIVLHNDKQLGMEASIAKGWEKTLNHVVCLHADTEVPYGWLERLSYPLFLMDMVAAVLPFSNKGPGPIFPPTSQGNNGVTRHSLNEVNQIFIEQGGKISPINQNNGPCMAINREYIEDSCKREWCTVLTDSLYVWHQKNHDATGDPLEGLTLWQLRDMLKEKDAIEGEVIVW